MPVDSDDDYIYDKNSLFGRINGAPRCGIALHVTPTKNRISNRDGAKTQYLIQGECNVFRNNTTYVCS